MTRSWYEIRAKAESNEAEVFLYDEIGGWGVQAKDFITELRELKGKSISLRIHSPGGSVLDGHAIYNALLRHSGGVEVQVDGLAASMASLLVMAGKKRKMAANAFLMIHNPWSVAMGESEDMRKAADILDKMRDGLVNIYSSRSGKSADEIEEMMNAETWMNAEEALEAGFIDEITDEFKVAAKFDLHKFTRVPVALVAEMITCENCGASYEPTEEKCPVCGAEKEDEEDDDEEEEVDKTNKAMSDQTLADLTAKHEAAAEQAKANFTALQTKTAEFNALKEAFDMLTGEIEAARKSVVETNAKLAEYQAKDAERVNDEAARIVASAGHPILNVGADDSSKPPTNHSAALEAITDPVARTIYFRKHQKEIREENRQAKLGK